MDDGSHSYHQRSACFVARYHLAKIWNTLHYRHLDEASSTRTCDDRFSSSVQMRTDIFVVYLPRASLPVCQSDRARLYSSLFMNPRPPPPCPSRRSGLDLLLLVISLQLLDRAILRRLGGRILPRAAVGLLIISFFFLFIIDAVLFLFFFLFFVVGGFGLTLLGLRL